MKTKMLNHYKFDLGDDGYIIQDEISVQAAYKILIDLELLEKNDIRLIAVYNSNENGTIHFGLNLISQLEEM